MKKNKILESVFSEKLTLFLQKRWSRPVERNFVTLIAQHKNEMIDEGEQGKQYLKDLLDKNQMTLEDNCTDEFLDELGRLSNEYVTEKVKKTMSKNKEAKEIKKGEMPPKIKLKADIFNHDASDDEDIEKNGTCLVKSGAILTWDDVQKAYKSGEKIVRPGLLHPSMYDVVGEDNKLSDKLPSLKKESVYTANEDQKNIQKTTGPKSETSGFNNKVKKTWDVNGDSGMSESKKINERVGMDAEDISIKIYLLKGISISLDETKQIATILRDTYGVRPKIKGTQEAVKGMTVETFPLSQLVNLRQDLKTINPNLEVDSVSIPNVSNNVTVDTMDESEEVKKMQAQDNLICSQNFEAAKKMLVKELKRKKPEIALENVISYFTLNQYPEQKEKLISFYKTLTKQNEMDESSRAENMTRNGRIRVFEDDDDLSDVNKIINETENELVNFHKDHTDVVDSWKDIQNKTPSSHTVIEEDVKGLWPKEPVTDVSKGKWRVRFDVKKIKGKKMNVVYTTFVSTDGIKYTGGAIIRGVDEMAKDSAIKKAKEIARSKATHEEPVLESVIMNEDPERGKQMGNTKANVIDPFDDIFNTTPSSKTIIEEEEETVNIHTDHVKEVDPWEDYGIESKWIEEGLRGFNETVTEPTLTDMQHNFLDEDESRQLDQIAQNFLNKVRIADNNIQFSELSVEGTPKGNWAVFKNGQHLMTIKGKYLDDATIMKYGLEHHDEISEGNENLLSVMESEEKGNTVKKLKVDKPKGGKKGIDDRVKEQEDKDESLEKTEQEYCNYDEWEEKLKELYKGKSVTFEDELYATVAYVDDEEVGEWKEDTVSGGSGKIFQSMFDELELIKEDTNITGIVGDMAPSSDLLEHDGYIDEICPKCKLDTLAEDELGNIYCAHCNYTDESFPKSDIKSGLDDDELDECDVILHEDMTTADMAVPDKPIGAGPLHKRKIEEIDRFFSEFVQKNCDVRGFVKEGKLDVKAYMKSRPYSLQNMIKEEFKKYMKEGSLQFSDGKKIRTDGPLRPHHNSDGWYVVGRGMCIPVKDPKEAEEVINELSETRKNEKIVESNNLIPEVTNGKKSFKEFENKLYSTLKKNAPKIDSDFDSDVIDEYMDGYRKEIKHAWLKNHSVKQIAEWLFRKFLFEKNNDSNTFPIPGYELFSESEELTPEVGNEEDIHDHLHLNENEDMNNYTEALSKVKEAIIAREANTGGTDAVEVGGMINQIVHEYNLTPAEIQNLRADIFDWRNEKEQ